MEAAPRRHLSGHISERLSSGRAKIGVARSPSTRPIAGRDRVTASMFGQMCEQAQCWV